MYPSDPVLDKLIESSKAIKKAIEIINATTSRTVLCIKVKNTYSEICFAVFAIKGA
jgi:hypothetical protein